MAYGENENSAQDQREEETRQEEARQEQREQQQEQQDSRELEASRQAAGIADVDPASASPTEEEATPGKSGPRQHRTGKSTAYLNELGAMETQLKDSEKFFRRFKDKVWRTADEEKQETAQMDLLRERDKVSNLAYRISGYRAKAKGRRRERQILQKVQKLLDRCDAVTGQFDSCMDAVKGSITDRKTEDIIRQLDKLRRERWDVMKVKKPNFAQYRKLSSWLDYIELQTNRLDAPISEKGIRRQKYLRGEIDFDRERLKAVGDKLSPEDQKEMKKRQEKSKILEQALNTKYNVASPIIRLIWKSKAVQGKHKIEKEPTGLEKAKDKVTSIKETWDEVNEDVSSVADPIVEHQTDGETESLGDWLKGHASTVIKWLTGKLHLDKAAEEVGGVMDKAEAFKEKLDELSDLFEPLVSAGKFIMGIGDFMKQAKDMSAEEIRRNMESILGDGLNFVVSNVLKLVGLFKPVPFLGAIADLFANAVTIVQQVLQMIDRRHYKKEVTEKKELGKAQMVEKKEKYAQDQDLKDLNLFGFAGTREESKGFITKKKINAAHIQNQKDKEKDPSTLTLKDQADALEAELSGSGNIYDQLNEMKLRKNSGFLSAEEKQKYYKMKTLTRIREHKEMKEDKYVNEKRIRQNWVDIAHEGVSVVANICDLIPGYGTAVSKGLSFGNSVAKVGHKYGTKIRQKFRDWTGSENSTENKAMRRSAMAENMYGQMLYVSNYMKEEGSTDPKEQLFSVGENSASKVSKQMNYLDMMSTTLSYQFSKMLGTENRDDLLDMMSSAFSREG